MKRIFAALLLALSVLGGSAALAMPASAATWPWSIQVIWTSSTTGHSIDGAEGGMHFRLIGKDLIVTNRYGSAVYTVQHGNWTPIH